MVFPHIIFTDLDGSLLELESYNHTIAEEKVTELSRQGIPIIFCSSKTFAEQRYYQKFYNLSAPMIIENGAAVAIPQSYHPYFNNLPHTFIDDHLLFSFAEGSQFILENIDRIRKKLDLKLFGYNDLTLSEISSITQLSEMELTRTTQRLFSETLLVGDFTSPNFKKMRQLLFEVNLQCTPGSKFYTITGISSNKGKAINWLTHHYKQITSSQFSTIGIGDSFNDLSMLTEVDRPFLVQKPDKTWADIDIPMSAKIEKIGPFGWNEIIEHHVGFS